MSKCDVLLIGFEDQENLGLRYIAAYLIEQGIRVEIVPCQFSGNEDILSRIKKADPKIVGFSLIFQRMFFEFKNLCSYLRKNGVNSHFTIGGHFPSLEYQKTLELMPELDSVVRHEGEETLLELYKNLDKPGSLSLINGLAYRKDNEIYSNPSRPLIKDLNSLPFPLRDKTIGSHRGLGICSILGSRGCYHNCSFCSIHQFYREPPGPLRRARSPSNIVQEIEQLLLEKNIRIFIFQDDEWFIKGHYHIQWLEDFIQELRKRNLADQILWRISCRIDDVNEELIRKMKDVGLMCVYLGIESGNNQGLRTFNKNYSMSDVYRAIDVLNKEEMPFEFGFMIFDPDSTFEAVHKNIKFLQSITEGGHAVAHFSKMVPYAGTSVARRLDREGRLKGTIESPDYCYNEPRLNILQFFFSYVFNFRNFHKDGLMERLRTAKFDYLVMKKFFSNKYDTESYEGAVKELIQQSNDSALEVMSLSTTFMKNRSEEEIFRQWIVLEQLASEEKEAEDRIASSLDLLETCYV